MLCLGVMSWRMSLRDMAFQGWIKWGELLGREDLNLSPRGYEYEGDLSVLENATYQSSLLYGDATLHLVFVLSNWRRSSS